MKTSLSILGGFLVVMAVLAMPVRAEMVAVSDSDMSGISGKANNQYLFSGTASTTIEVPEGSANVQFGWYQWTDNHAGGAITDHKGANDQSGTITTVQQNVVADVNVINWGAWAQLNWVSGAESSSGTIAQMPYGVMAVGGF